MTIFSLATKIFLREFRSGQLLLMFLSLSLAVGIVASITFFTDRLDGSLMMESKQFLGGDLKYESDTPLDNLHSQLELTLTLVFMNSAQCWAHPKTFNLLQ